MHLKNAEIEDGYTMDAVISHHVNLLMDVRDKLLFETEYAKNIKEKVSPRASLRIPWAWLSSILCLLQEIVHVTLDNYEPEMHNQDFKRGEAHHNWVDEVVRSEGRAIGSEYGPCQIRPRPDKKDPSLLTREEIETPKVWAQICLERMADLAKESSTMRRV